MNCVVVLQNGTLEFYLEGQALPHGSTVVGAFRNGKGIIMEAQEVGVEETANFLVSIQPNGFWKRSAAASVANQVLSICGEWEPPISPSTEYDTYSVQYGSTVWGQALPGCEVYKWNKAQVDWVKEK